MMGGAGAHGKGGHGEDDDEHETPAILINLDNTYEFMGDLPKASPAVIGDWSEQEKADKQAQERETTVQETRLGRRIRVRNKAFG